MSLSPYFQILGSAAGDANFGTPDAVGLPPKDQRRNTGNYLTPDLLIDFTDHTPGALEEYGINPASIRYLMISHGHFDHFQPLEIIRFAASLPHPLMVFGNSMVIDALELCRDTVYDEETGRFVAHRDPYNLETEKLILADPVTAGGAKVTPLLGNHYMNKPYNIMEQQSLNFLIEMGDKKVFYGLDSSYMMPQTLALLNGTHLDVAIMDATFGARQIDATVSGHHNWAMLDESLDDLRTAGCIDATTTIVAAHLSCNNIGLHEQAAPQQAARGITMAYDGLILPL
ncbi:MAG: MBL fold metallo-hydrolase [Candidatus Latescibacterota bacterium]|jgi:phosphoribosyl 1,2-cyclic phosphate phosphodiesterase